MKIKRIKTTEELNRYIDKQGDGCKYWMNCERCGFPECIYDGHNWRSGVRLLKDELLAYLYERGATPYLIARLLRWNARSVRSAIARYYKEKR